MFDIIGYWVMVTICCVPLLAVPVFFFGEHFNDVVKEHTDGRHQIKWWVWIEDNCPPVVAIILLILGIIEWVIFIITTISYYANHSAEHDYLLMIKVISTGMAPLASWVSVAAACWIAMHYAVIGYAKVLNMGDKLKDKEKKNV